MSLNETQEKWYSFGVSFFPAGEGSCLVLDNRTEKRLRMRAVDSFWSVFDRLINERLPPLNNVVLTCDFLAITTFDNLHERMETWREKANTTL